MPSIELTATDIDGEREMRHSRTDAPDSQLRTSHGEREQVERPDDSLSFRNGDKLLRCKQSAHRVLPAEKNFSAGQTFLPIHLRLEINCELAGVNAPAQRS